MEIIESTHESHVYPHMGEQLPCIKDWGTTETWYIPQTGECSLSLYDCDAATADMARASKLAQFKAYAAEHGMVARED